MRYKAAKVGVTTMKSLYDTLGLEATPNPDVSSRRFEDITDSKEFAEAILNSEEFRRYIVSGLTFGDLPPAILLRLMDYGWGKSPDRIEHTGKDGQPIVTEIRRIIVRAPVLEEEDDSQPVRKETTH